MTTGTSSKRRRIFNIIYLFLGIVLLVAGIYGLSVRMRCVQHTSIDFMQDYEALQNLLGGMSIYDQQAGTINYHPPTAVVFLLPLARLPYPVAAKLWGFFSLACFLILVWVIVRELEISLPIQWLLILMGALFCWDPLQNHISQGQFSIFISLSITLAWKNLRKKKELVGGILLGLACLMKLFPGLFIIYLIIRRKWVGLVSMFFVIGMGGLLTLAIVGFDDFWLYFTTIIPQDIHNFIVYPLNSSAHGMFSRFFTTNPWISPIVHAPWVDTLLINFVSIGLVVTLALLVYRLPPSLPGNDLAFSLHIPIMLLLSPLTWGHANILLLLPLGLLFKNQRLYNLNTSQMFFIVVFILLSLPDIYLARFLMATFAPYRPPWYAGLLMLGNTVGMVILLGELISQTVSFTQQPDLRIREVDASA